MPAMRASTSANQAKGSAPLSFAVMISVAIEALGRAGVGPKDVAAVGISNQRETTIVWDRQTGETVCNAIVWQDRRTAPFCDRLRADGYEQFIRDKTGLVIDAYFSGSKIAWILENVPHARAKAEAGRLAFGASQGRSRRHE